MTGPEQGNRPANCRNRLRDEGKAYPRSGCASCGDGGLRGCPYEGRPPRAGLSEAFTTPSILTASAFVASHLTISNVVSIDLKDGKVTYLDGATEDVASRRFWEAVGRMVRP